MGYYAKIDENNIVTEVIVSNIDFINSLEESSSYIETSKNMYGGVYYDENTNQPSSNQSQLLRKNYAGIGYIYDENRDAFIPPKPFNSWVLNEPSCLWDAPTAMPDDGEIYTWNEVTQTWDLVE
jgi:hypothetical protein